MIVNHGKIQAATVPYKLIQFVLSVRAAVVVLERRRFNLVPNEWFDYESTNILHDIHAEEKFYQGGKSYS